MSTLQIIFDNDFVLDIVLDHNALVDRWKKLLKQELSCKNILQTDTFSGLMPEAVARSHLKQAISTVNRYLGRVFIDMPKDHEFDDQQYYNALHEKFEMLAGPDWSQPTRLMQFAPPDVKLAVRHINRFCHRLERRPYRIEPIFCVEFDSYLRMPLEPEDYMFFEQPSIDGVYVDYSTLGKNLYECYQDDLPPSYAAMKMQNHYCANFMIYFGLSQDKRSPEGFDDWLKSHGVDQNQINNHGAIKLGHVRYPNQFEYVKQCSKIKQITTE